MKNLFRLVYVTEHAINLDKEENQITGQLLNSIGVHIDKKFEKEVFFTISKYEQNGILKWTITNNQIAKDLFINSKSTPTKDTEKKLSPGEKHPLKCLLDEKIYFYGINAKWDNLHFDKIKIEEKVEKYSSKKDNEPMEINLNELEDLMGAECDSAVIEKINKKPYFTPPLSASHELNQCIIEDKEDEIQRCSIFNQKSLEDLLDEYNLEGIIGGEKIINNNNINNNINKCAKLTKNESVLKTKINVSNIHSIPTKQLLVVPKVKKIVDDEEERENEDDFTSEIHRNVRNYVVYTPYKSIRSTSDDVMTEDINKLLEDYREQARKDSLSESFKPEINSNRQSLINISAKYGAEYNSNDKRIRPSNYSKEYESHYSAYSALKTKRLKKAPENKELKIDTNTTCAICLDNIIFLANLDSCSHDFCKPCIIEWSSKYSNVCPLCKKDFKKIIYYEKNKKKEIKVKKKKFKLDEEDDFGVLESFVEDSSDNCMVCNSNSDFPHMLVCDGCHYNVCHTYCDGLDTIPYDDWFCSACRQSEISNRRSRQVVIDDIDIEEEEGDDSDEMDDSYEPQIQLVNDHGIEEFVMKDKVEDVNEEEFSEENSINIDRSNASAIDSSASNVSNASQSSSNESASLIPTKNKRGRPRKIGNYSNTISNPNPNNNFNNLSVNISVNVNMTRRGRKITKNNEMDEGEIMPNNNNIVINSTRSEEGNLNNIRMNSSLGNYSKYISNDPSRRNEINNSERNNFERNSISNEVNKRGRTKPR